MFLDIVMGRKNQVGLTLSPRAVAVLDELAQQTELSRTDVIEAIAAAKMALKTDTPQWSFYLLPETDEATTVRDESAPEAASPEVEATAPPSEPQSPHSPPTATKTASEPAPDPALQKLHQEKAELQAQLAEARSQIHQLQTQSQSHTAPPTASAPSTAAQSAPLADVTEQLREQVLNLKAAYAELTAAHQQQQAETARLQAALAQAQPITSIGETQLNRWQYKTFSR